MSRFVLPTLLAVCLLLTGCYQARMTTGKEASNTVVEKKWTSSFLFGLVPANVDVSDECSNGIASAERKLSFLNMVVGGLTFNIYTPQSVTVTCAAGGSMLDASAPDASSFTVSTEASVAEVQNTLSTASLQSHLTETPVEIRVVGE